MPRVLLITSESFMLNLLKEKFEQEDFEVITAETIAEGLVEAQRSIPDLIVLEERSTARGDDHTKGPIAVD